LSKILQYLIPNNWQKNPTKLDGFTHSKSQNGQIMPIFASGSVIYRKIEQLIMKLVNESGDFFWCEICGKMKLKTNWGKFLKEEELLLC